MIMDSFNLRYFFITEIELLTQFYDKFLHRSGLSNNAMYYLEIRPRLNSPGPLTDP